MKRLLTVASIAITLTACSDKEYSFDTVEDARLTAKENGAYLARSWKANNQKFYNWNILSRGDSTIMPDCPMGDGWASIDLQNSENMQQITKLKCSTYSRGIGCMLKSDFEKRAQYANQEGRCNKDVPFPIKKITG